MCCDIHVVLPGLPLGPTNNVLRIPEISKDTPSPSKIRSALTKAWEVAKGTGKAVGGWVVEGAMRIALEKLKTGGL